MALQTEEFYTAANLNGNPFRPNPIYGIDPRIGIWVGYEKQRSQLIKFLTRSRSDQVGNINFVMLYGDYGTGKSHALLWAMNEICRTRKEEFDSVAYYIPTIKKEKGALTFAGAFKEDIIGKSSIVDDILQYRHFLRNIAVRYAEEHPQFKGKDEQFVVDELIEIIELKRLAHQILGCDTPAKIHTIICPDKMTDYQAMIIFTRLVNLFVLEMPLADGPHRFKKAAYLMIDEMDDLQRASAKEAREVNDILRHIYDSCPTNFGLVIALSAEVADMAAIFYDYLLERVSRRIAFDTMDRAVAINFVRAILDDEHNRLDVDGPRDFFPFEQDAVDAAASALVKITPRKIINIMQQVLEEVRLAGLDPSQATADLAFLDEHDILDEVLGDGGLG
jgi:hypothetical protein